MVTFDELLNYSSKSILIFSQGSPSIVATLLLPSLSPFPSLVTR